MSTQSPAPPTATAPSTADVLTNSTSASASPSPSPSVPRSTPPPDSPSNPPLKTDASEQPSAGPSPETSKKPVTPVKTSQNRPPDSLYSDSPQFATIPSYSKWFTWNEIHECELRLMPEFFDGKSPSKNPNVYKYYRNAIVKKFREKPSKKITFTEVRRTIVGDVGAIRRVFDFLETWGLINYSPSGKQAVRWEDKEGKSGAGAVGGQVNEAGAAESVIANGDRSKKLCSSCKSICTIACFVSSKYGLVLCARCYVRGNYRVGINSTEFRRVEISESAKTEWTDKETLQLLEAVAHFGADWKRVAEHVNGRNDKDCVARFIRLPFGEQLVESEDSDKDDSVHQLKDQYSTDPGIEPSAKRMRMTPLADASNPIIAQAAFLSALAGVDVAEAAAQAAVTAAYDVDNGKIGGSSPSRTVFTGWLDAEPGTASAGDSAVPRETQGNAEILVRKEEGDLEKAISNISEVQMQEIHDKITHYEETEMQLEKEWQHYIQMKDQLFLDQLALSFYFAAAPKSCAPTAMENVKSEQ